MLDREKLARRNTFFFILEGTIFWIGMAFIESNTVVSVFVENLTGSIALAGLAAAVRTGLYPVGQILMGMFIHKLRNQSRFMTIMSFCSRPVLLIMTPVLLSGVSGVAAVWVLIGCIAVFFLADGFVGLIWMEMLTRTIPTEKRGQVIGMQQVFSGIMGLAAGAVIRWILGSAFPVNHQFAIIFGLAGAMLAIDAFAIWQIHDNQPELKPSPPVNPISYFKQFVPLWKETPAFHTVIYTRVIYLFGMCAASLLVLYGQTVTPLGADRLTTLIFIQIFGSISGGLLLGIISRRLGYLHVMILSQFVNLVVPICAFAALFFGSASFMFIGVMVFLSSFNNSAWMGYTNHMLTIIPDGKSALYLVLQGIMIFPTSLLPFFVGGVAQAVGFAPVFCATLLSALAGIYVTWRAYGRELGN